MGVVGAIAGAAIGAAGSVAGGILSSNAKAKRLEQELFAKRQAAEASAGRQEAYSQMVQGEVALATEQKMAMEQARFNVLGSMGQPGTYGAYEPFGSQPGGLGGLPTYADSGSVLTSGKDWTRDISVTGADVRLGDTPAWTGSAGGRITGQVMDPDLVAGAVKQTTGFRAVSRMVADANDLMNRSGPLWEELNANVLGGIYQSAAANQREQMEQISRAVAQGGAAGRTGMNLALTMRTQDAVNRNRINAVWQGKLALEKYAKDYSMKGLEFAQEWVGNHPGLRDAYSTALGELRTMWSKTMPASLVAAATADARSIIGGYPSEQAAAVGQAKADAVGGAVAGLSGKLGGWLSGGGLQEFAGLFGAQSTTAPMGTYSAPGQSGSSYMDPLQNMSYKEFTS